MPPAVAAVVGAGASIGGSLLGASAQKKAAKKAAAAQEQASQIEAQTARENQQLTRDIYNSNLNVLSPYDELGYSAARARNALLGLGAGPEYTKPSPLTAPPVSASPGGSNALSGVGGVPPGPGYTFTQPSAQAQIDFLKSNALAEGRTDTLHEINAYMGANPGVTPDQALAYIQGNILPHHNKVSADFSNWLQSASTWTPPPVTTPTTGGTTGTTPATTPDQDYNAAFQHYLDSTGYKFQLGEGLKGLDHAERLTSVDSGAALKAAMDYNRNMGQSYFGDYMTLLGQQQGMGIGAAGAVAGQGNIAASAINASNTAAGNALANGAIGRGNAALAIGNTNANLFSNIGGTLDTLFGGSSFGGGGGAFSNLGSPDAISNVLRYGY